MLKCPACAGDVAATSRFCPGCGASMSVSATPTRITRSDPPMRSVSSSDSMSHGRFLPGAMLAGRYRIVGLLGRGGMGEVYRADDLKLSQPVAIKLLPEALSSDPERLARFHNEARLARQVSHPNVCRVYDIGEADGQHFISMEFVDGEDLASLLRRIGRLPRDKSMEISRQLCAGLAAAHERGVLHRDLKPANIMIDGRGKVRITDFGLAGLEGAVRGAEARAGTPTYMSPEQIAGREVTVRSDIYCLGLVLYEMFTGKSAFKADTLAELVRAHNESAPATPSSIVPGFDPAVERVILRCLEKDPAARPPGTLAVAAALPGGDPLAAALAAGETPSPEMVAAARVEGSLRPRAAWALLGVLIAGALIHLALYGKLGLVNRTPLDKPPEVLADRARDLLRKLGHAAPSGASSAYGFDEDEDYLDYIEKNDKSQDRWDRLANGIPPAIYFWHRTSPTPMIAKETFAVVSHRDPQLTQPGMTLTLLDPQGHLIGFTAVPPDQDEPAAPAELRSTDWSVLFTESGLDPNAFTAVGPSWTPPVYADARAAWTGSMPGHPDMPLRLEAASRRGRILWFRGVASWSEARSAVVPTVSTGDWLVPTAVTVVKWLLLICAVVLARRHLLQGKGDRSGAFKIGLFFLVVHIVAWSMWASHVPQMEEEWQIFAIDTGWTLFNAAFLWLMYLALEPYVRRLWPDTLISWNRLMAGRLSDPLVGRDLLVGTTLGVMAALILWSGPLLLTLFGEPPRPLGSNLMDLRGLRFSLAHLFDLPLHAMLDAMGALFMLLLLRVLLRRPWLANIVFLFLFSFQTFQLDKEHPLILFFVSMAAVSVGVYTLTRFGLLAGICGVFVGMFGNYPLTTDMSSWFAATSLMGLAALIGLGVYGFRTALAGQPLFKPLAAESLAD